MSAAICVEKTACDTMPDCGKDAAAPILSKDLDISALRVPENGREISSKLQWGGARPNSGGPRPNSGGARPGSGRPRKCGTIGVSVAVSREFPDTAQRWCVVAFWGQAEISATQELTRQGYETYLPMVAVRRRDRAIPTLWHTVRIPFLSGYGFIRMTQSESREPVTATHGVREILLRPDGRNACVPDGDVDRLRADDDKRLLLPKERGIALAAGAPVRVEDGPFADHLGRVVECDGVRTRVELMIFGRLTLAWLDRTAVGIA